MTIVNDSAILPFQEMFGTLIPPHSLLFPIKLINHKEISLFTARVLLLRTAAAGRTPASLSLTFFSV